MSSATKPVEQKARELLSSAFGQPIHVPPREFLERVLAGMFSRQPDMSGDQRKRLNSHERRIVEGVAGPILAALEMAAALNTDGERIRRLEDALEEIVNPLQFLKQRAAATGDRLSDMAYSITNDVEYLRGIARTALSTPSKGVG